MERPLLAMDSRPTNYRLWVGSGPIDYAEVAAVNERPICETCQSASVPKLAGRAKAGFGDCLEKLLF